MTRPMAEPWPTGDAAETLITGPTVEALLGPPQPGPWPWPRDPLYLQADEASLDDEPAPEEERLW